MKRYLHISFNFNDPIKVNRVKPVIEGKAEDWIRYNGNTWVIWTSFTSEQLYTDLAKHLMHGDQVVILEIASIKGHALVPDWVTAWFNKTRY